LSMGGPTRRWWARGVILARMRLGAACRIGLGVGALGIVSCSSSISEEEARARAAPRIQAARREGAAFREALPWCEASEVPEGAHRIEGRLLQGMMQCTQLLCVPDVCCNECRGPVFVHSDAGQEAHLLLPREGPIKEHFRGYGGTDCEHHAWWDGVMRVRVRMTWSTPDDKPGGELIELCRVRP